LPIQHFSFNVKSDLLRIKFKVDDFVKPVIIVEITVEAKVEFVEVVQSHSRVQA
jgi:hypothetical protein